MGWGPIAPAQQSMTKQQPRFQRAWMRSVAPPYYDGVGIAVRFGANTLRFGVCYPLAPLTRPDTEGELVQAVFGRDVDKTQEGQWDSGDERSA